jgi:hypothetical protein
MDKDKDILRDLANRKASYTRHYGPADPRTVEASRELTVRKLARDIEVALTAQPPITDAQRSALARMLVGAEIEVAA